MQDVILASGSSIRAELLKNANVPFTVAKPRIDEETITAALQAEAHSPRDIADHLAEMKARKVSEKSPEALTLGCDQVLAYETSLLAKPASPEEAQAQLKMLSGQTHNLYSAAVIAENGRPIWRYVGHVRLHMRPLSDAYIQDYLSRHWDRIRESAGSYRLEEEGVRFFSRIEGDYFTVLGMPLLPVLDYLTLRGVLQQ